MASRTGPQAGGQRSPATGASRRPGRWQPDPSDTDDAEIRHVQPYQATKPYRCPGCNRDIPAGQGHLVAVPPEAPDLRRHWHRGCWDNRRNLR
jgi:hypothetical protein